MPKFAKIALVLLVFSLPFMKLSISIGGLAANLTDLFFVIAAFGLAIGLITGEARLRWHSFFAVLIAYFTAMLISGLVAEDPGRALIKLASQAYLVSLPMLIYCLIDSAEDLRAVFRSWLAATAVTAGIGFATVLLFAFGVDRSTLGYALHGFGTLPPGDYPRLESTFGYPAMLCNYLTVSLSILLICRHFGWIKSAAFYVLLVAIGVAAAFSLTPGLGGILLVLGVWLFLRFRERSPPIARTGLAIGGSLAVVAILAAAVTPIAHPTAPFFFDVPGIEFPLAPSVRMMTWMAAAATFMQHPLVGAGIGSDAIAVGYVAPSGGSYLLTDAHNVFLNVAMQCGLLGLAALIFLIFCVYRLTLPLRFKDSNVLRIGLGLAWLNAFAYQGITGSYEDARHLWVLLGLLLASIRLEPIIDHRGCESLPTTVQGGR